MRVAVAYNRESRKVTILFGTPNRETIGLETLKRITEAIVLCRASCVLGAPPSYPWNTRLIPWLLTRMGREFPLLTNHFFVLRPSLSRRAGTADRRDTSLHGPQLVEERFENGR